MNQVKMEEKVKKTSQTRRIITSVALVLMLVVLPLGSWVYLNKGANFYRGVMKELGDYGTLPAFNLKTAGGMPMTEKDFDKKLSIFSFTEANPDSPYFQGMKYAYEQFTDNEEVVFATIGTTPTMEMTIDSTQWFFLHGEPSPSLNTLLTNDTIAEMLGEDLENALILVDTNMVVRNYYLASDTTQINRMITTMSLLMPRPEKASVKFEREKEK